MNLQHPEALYFILPVIVLLLALALYARSKRRSAAAAFADAAMGARILPREDSARFWSKLILLELAAVFSLLALARPQWGDVVEEVKVKGSDLYVLIDVSRSMLARDVAPSRLERAKLDVSSLLNRLKGERVGLIAFAGRAAVKCPLTSDYAFLRVALNELGPHSVDRGGTAIGDAIRVALNVLPKAPDRDQALLLITDGDDQESEPMSAVAQAAERHVTIFTVGLGDPNEGARVPDKEGVNMRYDGKDVVSKMDDELLSKMALKTGGAYVPARTSAYDLGKLYEEKLSLLRGEYVKEQKRRRMSERFEIPLFFAVLCFILELAIRPYQPERKVVIETDDSMKPKNQKKGGATPMSDSKNAAGALGMLLLGLVLLGGGSASAADSHSLAGEGFKLYEKKDYKAAGEKFNEAEKGFDRDQRDDAARAAFDAGCAFQRAGEMEKAREAYMKAALAPGKALAAAGQFNLGTLATDEAKKIAGEKPEEIPAEKRAEIVEKLKVAVAHFRSALDLQADYPGARSNIELVRQWLKLYVNKWAELDRKKRREGMNLLQYLDELAKMQRALKLTTKALDESAGPDEYAEIKRAQDELFEEIDPLKEKIQKEIGGAGGQPNAQPGAQLGAGAVDPKQLEAAVKKLHEWADEAGGKMRGASSKLLGGDRDEAMTLQKDAVAPLERSWEALAPFGATLQRDYDEQSKIVGTLDPNEVEKEDKKDEPKDSTKTASKDEKKEEPKEKPKEKVEPPTFTKEQMDELAEFQGDVLRRTDALKFKAEKELAEVEKQSPTKVEGAEKDKEPKKEKEWLTLEDVQREEAAKKRAEAEKAKGDKVEPKKEDENAPPDPEAIKKGLKLAIELAPKAAEKMNAALGHLKKQESAAALPDTLEARRILKEILDAQPKQKNKNQDDKKDQQNKDQNQDKDKQDQKDKKEQDKDKKDQDQQKKDEEKKKEEEQKKKDQDKKKDEKQEQEKQQTAKAEMSKDKAEEMLRKIQERELQRRKQKADDKEAIYGRMQGVEKDW